MKPLTLEETKLKEEMKERCLAKEQYIDENAKAKFEMLCHLEDFEVQYWELQQENKILKEKYENAVADYETTKAEKNKLKKQLEQYKGSHYCSFIDICKSTKIANYNQQKEFIDYLENEINKLKEQIKNYDIWHEVGTDINFLILKKQFYLEILQKYKEITGVLDENTIK